MANEVTTAATAAAASTEQVQTGSAAQAAPPIGNTPASESKTEVATDGAAQAAPAAEGAKASETGGEQKTEPAKAESKVPEKYELKAPEGSLLEGRIEKIESLAKERGFSNEVAQAILDSEVAAVQEFVEQTKPQGKLWNAQLDQWEKAALSDREIGGTPEKLKESTKLALEALEDKRSGFFPPGFKEFLYQTGLGSHPDMVKALVRIRNAMGNDKAVHAAPGTAQPKSIIQRMYGDSASE